MDAGPKKRQGDMTFLKLDKRHQAFIKPVWHAQLQQSN